MWHRLDIHSAAYDEIDNQSRSQKESRAQKRVVFERYNLDFFPLAEPLENNPLLGTALLLGSRLVVDFAFDEIDNQSRSQKESRAQKRVVFEWFGQWKEIQVVPLENNPLLGTALLLRSRLVVDFVVGGAVDIQPM